MFFRFLVKLFKFCFYVKLSYIRWLFELIKSMGQYNSQINHRFPNIIDKDLCWRYHLELAIWGAIVFSTNWVITAGTRTSKSARLRSRIITAAWAGGRSWTCGCCSALIITEFAYKDLPINHPWCCQRIQQKLWSKVSSRSWVKLNCSLRKWVFETKVSKYFSGVLVCSKSVPSILYI